MSAYRDVFLSESAEYIQGIVDGLLALESNPGNLEPVEVVFRGAHSLKGMAGAMGYELTADLTHKMEGLMDTVRKGIKAIDSDLIDLMLRAVDTLRELIDEESEGRAPKPIDGLVAELAARTAGESRSAPEARGEAPEPVAEQAAQGVAPAEGGVKTYSVFVRLDSECVLKSVRAYMVLKRMNYIGTVLETTPTVQEIEDEEFGDTFALVLKTTQSEDQVRDAGLHITDVADVKTALVEFEPEAEAKEQAPERKRAVEPAAPKLSDTQTVRISITHLDSLVNLIGELVIVRSRLERSERRLADKDLTEALEDFRRISAELQHEVMQTRMVPVANIFNRFPRMVRDLGRELGKDVDFVMEGLDIDLDRTVLDEIGDPVVHLLRNAIDHGLETPEVRSGLGKPERGRVMLAARRERDHVQIVVSDDGRGMDHEIIWSKAIDRGLVAGTDRDSCTVGDILLLTCSPGFSTAETATKVSGRGVGMDVVKGKIEYLGGSLTINSEVGVGSEFTLTLPLTLAIIQALLVSSHGYVFAIPLSAVSEVLSPHDLKRKEIDGSPVAVLRDSSVVSVYNLDEISALGPADAKPGKSEHVLLLDSGDQVRALEVTELIGRQEIVIKPLAGMFGQLRGLGGATVLGDGSIALILDPRSFFAMGEVPS